MLVTDSHYLCVIRAYVFIAVLCWTRSGAGDTGEMGLVIQVRWGWSCRWDGAGDTGEVGLVMQVRWGWWYRSGGAGHTGEVGLVIQVRWGWLYRQYFVIIVSVTVDISYCQLKTVVSHKIGDSNSDDQCLCSHYSSSERSDFLYCCASVSARLIPIQVWPAGNEVWSSDACNCPDGRQRPRHQGYRLRCCHQEI